MNKDPSHSGCPLISTNIPVADANFSASANSESSRQTTPSHGMAVAATGWRLQPDPEPVLLLFSSTALGCLHPLSDTAQTLESLKELRACRAHAERMHCLQRGVWASGGHLVLEATTDTEPAPPAEVRGEPWGLRLADLMF